MPAIPARIAVTGATGRMGREVLLALRDAPGLRLGAALVRPGHPGVGRGLGEILGDAAAPEVALTDDPAQAFAAADAVIDFSLPRALDAHLPACVDAGRPLVLGTTGLDARQLDALREAAAVIPVLHAANFSAGVTLALHLLGIAARVLEDADVEIVETHHRHKLDAPSGTALRMAEAVAEARGMALREVVRHGRHGSAEPRSEGEIGIHALRGGEVVGDHRVLFAGADESLEIHHAAGSRGAFARGALRAARWLLEGRAPGLYDMPDVLGIGA